MAAPPHDPFNSFFFSLVSNEKCLKGFEILPHPSHAHLALHILKPRGPPEVKESKEVAEEEERSRRARREGWAGISCLSAFHRSAGSKEVFKQHECCSGIYYKAWRDLCWFSVSNNKCSSYDGSEDQNGVAPAGSFNRNSSVIILNCERAKLCNVVCGFVPQSWTKAMIHFFFLHLIDYLI